MTAFWYLVAYDVCHPKRLRRVHQRLTATAYPLQKSIFLYRGNKNELNKLYSDLLREINDKEDDLKIMPISSKWYLQFWGQSPLDKELHNSQWPQYKQVKAGEWHGRVVPKKTHFNTPPLRYA